MGCGAERAPQFRRESAGRKECADHFSIPFLQEELAVIFVRGVYQEIDIVFPLVAYVQQLPFGEGQQFVGERRKRSRYRKSRLLYQVLEPGLTNHTLRTL